MLKSLKKLFKAEIGPPVDRPLPEAEHYLREWGVSYKKTAEGRLEVETLDLSHKGLTELPDLGNVVVRNLFSCADNALTSLKGSPHRADYFICSRNKLTSLEGATPRVGASFICDGNALETLEGAPWRVRHFSCDNNKLLSLEGAPRVVSESLSCTGNPMETLAGAPKHCHKLRCDYGEYDELVHKIPAKLLRPIEETAAWRDAQEKKARVHLRRGGFSL